MQTIIALAIVAICAGLVLRSLVRAVLPGRRARACLCNGCPATAGQPLPATAPGARQRPAA